MDVEKLKSIFTALDEHLGDTDPQFPPDTSDDDIRREEPVFWAAREIGGLIQSAQDRAERGDWMERLEKLVMDRVGMLRNEINWYIDKDDYPFLKFYPINSNPHEKEVPRTTIPAAIEAAEKEKS